MRKTNVAGAPAHADHTTRPAQGMLTVTGLLQNSRMDATRVGKPDEVVEEDLHEGRVLVAGPVEPGGHEGQPDEHPEGPEQLGEPGHRHEPAS